MEGSSQSRRFLLARHQIRDEGRHFIVGIYEGDSPEEILNGLEHVFSGNYYTAIEVIGEWTKFFVREDHKTEVTRVLIPSD